jgi:hypothetical protein
MITWQIGFVVGGILGMLDARLGFATLAVIGLLAVVV